MHTDTKYTPQEEFLNAFSHSLGAMFAIYAIVMLAVNSKTAVQTASTAIFGSMLFILFQSSALYHAMVNETAKKVFRKIDHSAIFMLIAGTYTPILLLTVDFPLSVALLAMTWYLAITGIVYSCLTLKFKYLSTGLYLVMGWLSIFLVYSIWQNAGLNTVWLLLLGGLFYSSGCIFYLLKKKYMHCIWHIFVIMGAISHYFCILQILKHTN
ncbi:MAG: hemolysin III family protein [Candidatus Gastranaerophilales bacterium]|nr:hemolysin III family protein [Candidatus Gastranaerophilales bacterium]